LDGKATRESFVRANEELSSQARKWAHASKHLEQLWGRLASKQAGEETLLRRKNPRASNRVSFAQI